MKSDTMHGEYKTPGGKLVIVDFSVANSTLNSVQVSGDFFLYPDDALPQITAAMEGLPITADGEAIAHRIANVLAPDVVMLGFSPQAIGFAIRNALEEQP